MEALWLVMVVAVVVETACQAHEGAVTQGVAHPV